MMNLLNTFAAIDPAAVEDGAYAAEASEGIGALGLSLPAIGASALTFLVLFWIIKKYALDGIVANLEKRESDISRGLHLTAQMDKKAAELELTVEKALKAARKEADGIIANARTETGAIIAVAEKSATTRGDAIIRAAEGRIEREVSQARQDLKSEMASLVTEATESILNQKLDAPSDRKLVENYLSEAME